MFKAARDALVLCALFCVVYGSTNYLASLRSSVGCANFEWERQIPFVPLFIVPYMSINLFFVAAPFLCRTDAERRTHFRRMTVALLAAGLVFVVFPLRCAFERTEAEGPLGLVFNRFRELDRPFNEFPSLHVAFGTILGAFYFHRTRGVVRVLVSGWFVLIVLSAVLTYQHHVVDVAGGLALGIACTRLVGRSTGDVSVATASPIHSAHARPNHRHD